MKAFLDFQNYYYYCFLINVTYNFGLKYLNHVQQIRGLSHFKMSYIPAKYIHIAKKKPYILKFIILLVYVGKTAIWGYLI